MTLDKIELHACHRHVGHCPALLGEATAYKPHSLTLLSCTDTLSLPPQALGPSQREDEKKEVRKYTNVSMTKSELGLWLSVLAVSKANPGSTYSLAPVCFQLGLQLWEGCFHQILWYERSLIWGKPTRSTK